MSERHVVKALNKFLQDSDNPDLIKKFITIENAEDVKGVAPSVKFTIQSDPIGEVGINGVQALDMLKYVRCLFQSLNETFPCEENLHSITNIDVAIIWQNKRTQDRLKRNVEGKHLA